MALRARADATPTAPAARRFRGFRTLLRKDDQAFWGTRKVWTQTAAWLLVLVGLVAQPLVFARQLFAGEGESLLSVAANMFFAVAVLGPSIAAIIVMHGAILGERQLGTAAWVLSKPVSRSAFVLSKLVSRTVATFASALVLPSIAVYLLLAREHDAAFSAAGYWGGVGLAALAILFYLTLTLTLGTVFDNRGAVLGLPLALLLAGDLLVSLVPAAAQVLPSALPKLATLATLGQPLPLVAPIPATAAWCLVFVLLALWRFGRAEL